MRGSSRRRGLLGAKPGEADDERPEEADAGEAVPSDSSTEEEHGMTPEASDIPTETETPSIDVAQPSEGNGALDGAAELAALQELAALAPEPAAVRPAVAAHAPAPVEAKDPKKLTERILVLERQLNAARLLEEDLTAQGVKDQGALADAESKVAEMASVLESAEERAVSAEARSSALEVEFSSVSTRLAQVEEAHDAVRLHAEELRAKIDVMEEELTSARTRLAEIEGAAAESETLRARLSEVEADSQRRAEEAARAASEARAATQRLSDQLQETAVRAAELESSRAAAEERSAAAESRMAKAEGEATRLRQIEEAFVTSRDHLAEVKAQAEAAGTELAASAARVAELEAAVTELTATVEEITATVATAEQDRRRADETSGQLAQLEGELTVAHSQLAELEGVAIRVAELEGAAVDAEERVMATEQRAAAAEALVAGLESQLAEATAQGGAFDAAKAESDRLQAELAAGAADVQRLEAEVASANERAEAEHARAEETQAQLGQVPVVDPAVQNRAAELETELAAATERLSTYEDAYEALQAQADESAKRAAELESALATAQEGGVAGVDASDNSKLEQDLRHAAERILELEKSLEARGTTPGDGATPRESDLETLVADLEERLEQTEVRARRAYSAAEAAEAALRFAKERGEVVVTSDPEADRELARLRTELPVLTERLREAQEAAKLAESQLAQSQGAAPSPSQPIAPATVEDDSAIEDNLAAETAEEPLEEDLLTEAEIPAEEPEDRADPPAASEGKKKDDSGEKGTSLRTRLARSAANKKAGKRSEWS